MYEIDDKMLEWTDEFEGHPEVYQRDRLLVTLCDEQPADNQRHHQRPPDGSEQNHALGGACAEGGRTIECWVYFLKHIRPSMLELPCYENYSSLELKHMQYDAA